jgi:archaemetzincin
LFNVTLVQCPVQRQWTKRYSNGKYIIFDIPAITWSENIMDDPDFEKMGKPEVGEWLFQFHEGGQSFEEYVSSHPVRTTASQQVLVFQPVGLFSPYEKDILRKATEFAGIWFDIHTRIEPVLPLPVSGWQRIRRFSWKDEPVKQYKTGYFLNKLLPGRIPPDAVCYLAITMADLYPKEGWNFVFGQASLSNRVGVYSMARYFPRFWGQKESSESHYLAFRRSCKVLAHEVGHIFGLAHCIYYKCAMNGSNSLEESDRRPLRLCPICLKKLKWNRGFDIISRYERLKGFFESQNLQEEAAWVNLHLKRIRPNRLK